MVRRIVTIIEIVVDANLLVRTTVCAEWEA
jgi:hypothetical protein